MSDLQSSHNTAQTGSTAEVVDSGINADAPIGFFAIGVAINLVLLAAYGIWAWRRWQRPDRPE